MGAATQRHACAAALRSGRWRAVPDPTLQAIPAGQRAVPVVRWNTRLGAGPRRPLAGGRGHCRRGGGVGEGGVWLGDGAIAGEATVAELATLERDAPSLTWLIAPQDLEGLGQLLQLRLDVNLPDGRSALLRF